MAQEGRPLDKGVSGEKGRLLVSLGHGLLGMLSAQNQFQPVSTVAFCGGPSVWT